MTTGWDEATTARVGKAVRAARERKGWSAKVLADRTSELGHAVGRATISELETGRRRNVAVAELLILAEALEVPPIVLLYSELPDGHVEVLPGRHMASIDAVMRFAGEPTRPDDPRDKFVVGDVGDGGARDLVRAARYLAGMRDLIGSAELDDFATQLGIGDEDETKRQLARLRGNRDGALAYIRGLGGTVSDE